MCNGRLKFLLLCSTVPQLGCRLRALVCDSNSRREVSRIKLKDLTRDLGAFCPAPLPARSAGQRKVENRRRKMPAFKYTVDF